MRNRLLLVVGLLLVATACSPEGDSSPTTSAVTSTASSSATTTTEGTTTTEATTTVVSTTTSQQIDVTFEDGQVVGPERFTYSLGDEISIWVLSDTDEEIHVHGYHLFLEAEAGTPLEIALTADVPGIFEVELESTHTLLFQLEVTP